MARTELQVKNMIWLLYAIRPGCSTALHITAMTAGTNESMVHEVWSYARLNPDGAAPEPGTERSGRSGAEPGAFDQSKSQGKGASALLGSRRVQDDFEVKRYVQRQVEVEL